MSARRNDSLKDVLLSKGFRSESVRAIEAQGEWRELDSGETLLDFGQIVGSLGIVTTGSADVVGQARDGGTAVVASVERADLVGWEALLGAQPTLFAFRVREAARLWEISVEGLEILFRAEPQAAIDLADMALFTMLRIQRESGVRLRGAEAALMTPNGRCSLWSKRGL